MAVISTDGARRRAVSILSDQEQRGGKEVPLALRRELARVREEAGNALGQMRGELDALRLSQDSVRDVESVTEQIAMQQELDTLRRSLSERERQVDNMAAQCRRLEDALEDQHSAYDGVKQDLDRKKRSLAVTREQVARVSHERMEIETHYQSLLSAEQRAALGERPQRRPRAKGRGFPVRLIGALLAVGLFAVGAFALWVRWDPLSTQDGGTMEEQRPVEKVAATPATGAGEVSATGEEHQSPARDVGESLPVVTEAVRDRLKDGSAGPPMLALQGGDFTMGKQRTLPNDDEGPARGVRLDGYLIGETEVTFEEYDRFARSTGRSLPKDFGWGRGRRPVVDVSWEDARSYARWLSRQTGRTYRLPSEAEWEYAAAAGRRSSFWWGYQAGQGRAVCFDCGTMWDNRSSAPVGSFDPNPLGVHDTAGNVMEWVEDCYHPNYSRAPLDGRPWVDESCGFRVARGGAFNKPARSMRTTARHRIDPHTRINYLGFRLARDE